MNVEAVLDTNILIYAAAGGKSEDEKRRKAFALIERGSFGLSAQILAEFYWIVTRKPARPLSSELAALWIDRLCTFPVLEIDSELVRRAIVKSRRFNISYWDAAILAAAEKLGAQTLYSEDLNHGQAYGHVRVVNPFL